MKKTFLFTIVLFFASLYANAQYPLVHDFNSDDAYVITFDTKSQTMYYFVDYAVETMYLYNEDFSFYNSVTAPDIEGYEIYLNSSFEYVSSDIFNDDTLIEFSCKYFKNGLPSIFIFNENLDEIASYDSASIHSIYETKSGQIRMDVNKYSFPSTKRTTLTYLLQELTTSVSDVNETYIKQAYPNPAISIINLPYQIEPGETAEMKIYDINGKLMKTISIGSHFNQIKLNTSGYKPGMYIYRYNDKSGKFLVK